MTFPTTAIPVDITDPRWAEGQPCHFCCKTGYVAFGEPHQLCSGTGRIPFARVDVEEYTSGGEAIRGGTTPLNLVLARGECERCVIDGIHIIWKSAPPCPTCHATGFTLVDPFALGKRSKCMFFNNEQLATLYADIASLADTCIVHIVLETPESVERMRAFALQRDEKLLHPATSVYWRMVPGSPHNWPGWPLTNIRYYTPGADRQLEVLQ